LPSEYVTSGSEKNGKWAMPDNPSFYNLGDIVLFNFKTIHAATEHRAPYFRLSIDTRIAILEGSSVYRYPKFDESMFLKTKGTRKMERKEKKYRERRRKRIYRFGTKEKETEVLEKADSSIRSEYHI
jgi:hypothetical protein